MLTPTSISLKNIRRTQNDLLIQRVPYRTRLKMKTYFQRCVRLGNLKQQNKIICVSRVISKTTDLCEIEVGGQTNN